MCHLIEDAVNVLGTKNPKKGQFIEAQKGVKISIFNVDF